MRLLLKTKEMMTITIVISTQMMGRVILLPSPMIITTPLMVVSTLQLLPRGYDMAQISTDGIQDDGRREWQMSIYPSTSSSHMRSFGPDTTRSWVGTV